MLVRGGKELTDRIKLAQRLYEGGLSVDEVAEKIGVKRALAWMNCQGYANHRDFMSDLEKAREEMIDLISPQLSRIGRVDCYIENYHLTRNGIYAYIDPEQSSGDFTEAFEASVTQTLLYSKIEFDAEEDFGFIFTPPDRMSVFTKLVRGIRPLRKRAFLWAYGETVIDRQVEEDEKK